MKSNIKQNIRYFLLLALLLLTIILAINFYVLSFSKSSMYDDLANIKNHKIGLVLGASVRHNAYPSDILADRLDTALEAYKKGKISKIIVSGDNSIKNYNEPQVMENYLVSSGVKLQDIYKDYAGFDTYDSIYRAKEIFQVKSLVIFTQKFHLKRALYIANKLGINAVGMISDKHNYLGINYLEFREFFSRIKAFLEVELLKTEPKFLGEKIDIK